MKSEIEIRKKIKELEAKYIDATDGIARLVIRQPINNLRWTLNEKTVPYYFCEKCNEPHKFLQCPICGGKKERSLVWYK